MRCLKKAIAREMYREIPTTTGVASRLTVRRRMAGWDSRRTCGLQPTTWPRVRSVLSGDSRRPATGRRFRSG